MNKPVSYTLQAGWFSSGDRAVKEGFRSLRPHQKLLLLSDGSLTVELELLYGDLVVVEMIKRDFTILEPEDAEFMAEDMESESLEREVWLTVGGERLVFARTLIPVKGLAPELLEELRDRDEPLGRMLRARHIPFSKESLEVGLVSCPEVSGALGLDPAPPLTARRYLLANSEGGADSAIKASVTEIFNPDAVPAGDLKAV